MNLIVIHPYRLEDGRKWVIESPDDDMFFSGGVFVTGRKALFDSARDAYSDLLSWLQETNYSGWLIRPLGHRSNVKDYVVEIYTLGYGIKYLNRKREETSEIYKFSTLESAVAAAAKHTFLQDKDKQENEIPDTTEVGAEVKIWNGGDQNGELVQTEPIRTFETGATRDTSAGKLSYVRGLSPIVLKRYLQYLDKHRLQPDGSMREFDNWKKGIPVEDYLDSLVRHAVDTWLLSQGFSAEDNHGPVELENVLCAIIFNSTGYLHEILKGKETCPRTNKDA